MEQAKRLEAGYELGEQEKYKQMLEKVIEDTESEKITTIEEAIQRLVYELTGGTTVKGQF